MCVRVCGQTLKALSLWNFPESGQQKDTALRSSMLSSSKRCVASSCLLFPLFPAFRKLPSVDDIPLVIVQISCVRCLQELPLVFFMSFCWTLSTLLKGGCDLKRSRIPNRSAWGAAKSMASTWHVQAEQARTSRLQLQLTWFSQLQNSTGSLHHCPAQNVFRTGRSSGGPTIAAYVPTTGKRSIAFSAA